MAVEGSLKEIKRRLSVRELKKEAAKAKKFRGSLISTGTATPLVRAVPFIPDIRTTVQLPGPSRTSVGLPPLTFDVPGQDRLFTESQQFTPTQTQALGNFGCDQLEGAARDACLLLISLLPGGVTPAEAIVEAGTPDPLKPAAKGTGVVVQGSFGLPAALPTGTTRVVRGCGPRMVLGIDNLCYPKAVLPPRSRFRKWRRAPKPPITRRDVVAIRRAAGARDRVAELAKDVGLSVTKTKRKTKSKHVHHTT